MDGWPDPATATPEDINEFLGARERAMRAELDAVAARRSDLMRDLRQRQRNMIVTAACTALLEVTMFVAILVGASHLMMWLIVAALVLSWVAFLRVVAENSRQFDRFRRELRIRTRAMSSRH